MARTIRAGIIGAGHITNQRYLTGYQHVADAEVFALADSFGDRAAKLAAQWNVPHSFTDVKEMLARSEIDVVHVCAPPFTHAPLAIAALEAGKHVYVEKPPALNADEVRAMVRAARRAGKNLMMGSNTVYYQEVQALRPMIRRGDLGDIYYAKILSLGRRGAPHGWFRQRSMAGGGVLMDGVSHSLDVVLYLLGTPRPRSVTARAFDEFKTDPARANGYLAADIAEGGKDVPVSEVEEFVTAFVQFENGLTLSVDAAWKVHLDIKGGIFLGGTKAGARVFPLEIFRDDADGNPTSETPTLPEDEKEHIGAIRHFVECARDGRETESPGERSIVTMEVFDAIYESARNGGREVLVGRQSAAV
ncbi:MAG: Gfo/Idh/MocA family oxidoreductase [Chloroflexota bacterium]|nr:MAG: Gfo/Idh/MocA family oxidoreductase [Chloroflexota bacterium]